MTGMEPASTLPASIDRTKIVAALAELGIPSKDLLEVTFAVKHVEVTYRRRGANGQYFVAGNEIATVTVTINVNRAG